MKVLYSNAKTTKKLHHGYTGVYSIFHKSTGMIALIVVGDTPNKDDIAKAKAVGKSKKKLKALLSEL